MAQLIQLAPIPSQFIFEQSAFGPLDLKHYFVFLKEDIDEDTLLSTQLMSEDIDEAAVLHFSAMLDTEDSLPAGLICTSDGLLTGIPAKGTAGGYQVLLTVTCETEQLNLIFPLTIRQALVSLGDHEVDELKKQIWTALGNGEPAPDLLNLLDRPVTKADIYYFLEKWGTLKIWDAFNLEPPGELIPLEIEDMSPHYRAFDRGSCLIAGPIDLFSPARTLEDGLQMARALAREVYKRDWTIEMVGIDKFMSAAWVELEYLAQLHGKKLNVINYPGNPKDELRYNALLQTRNRGR